jgi:hypothetical protein
MYDPRDPNAFDVQFVLQGDRDGENWNKKLKFQGEIDLGDFEGELTCQNSLLNWNEMKGKVYSQMFAKIEEALSLRAFGGPPMMGMYPRKKEEDNG